MRPTILFNDVAPWSIKPMGHNQKRLLVMSGAIATGFVLLNAIYAWGEQYDDLAWRKTDNPGVARIVGGQPSRADSIRSLLNKQYRPNP